jgi:HEAT repeat protein
MKSDLNLLSDEQVRSFIVNGFHSIEPDVPDSVHDGISARLDELIAPGKNPGDNVLPLIPDLQKVLDSPAIRGALTSIFGHDYIIMPHRHCHEMGFNADDTDRTYLHYFSHQDGHAPPTRATHHVPRYGLLLYYPQEVPLDFGPTHVLPGTQYHKGLIREEKERGRPTGGAKGSAAITHFDAGHGAGVNRRQQMRYMVKFVISRSEDPAAASWINENPEWIKPDNLDSSHEQPLIWQHVWNWMRGQQNGLTNGDKLTDIAKLLECIDGEDNQARNQATYELAAHGPAAVQELIGHIDSHPLPETNPSMMERADGWGNPSVMEDAAFALAAVGKPAVPQLVEALSSKNEWLRINAAFALGEIGRQAGEAVPALCRCLDDASYRVVHTAAHSLGIIHSEQTESVPALTAYLAAHRSDEDNDWQDARITVAASLLKLSPPPQAEDALIDALGDPDFHVRYFSMLALRRIGTATAYAAACDYLHAHCWSDEPAGAQDATEE